MISPENYKRLVSIYGKATAGLTGSLVSWLIQTWRTTPERHFYDDDMVLANAAHSDTGQEAASQKVRDTTFTFQKQVLRAMDTQSLDITIGGGVAVTPRNADSLQVWQRPAEQYRYARSQGKSHDEAVNFGLQRVQDLATMNNTLEARRANREILAASVGVTGYRRVIHPELTQTGTCGLCAAASTRIYKVDELMPIHNNCVCTVAPIMGDQDPGSVLNAADLNRLYQMAGGTYAEQLSRVKYQVNEHGEYGPMLVASGRRQAPPRKRAGVASDLQEVDEDQREFESVISPEAMWQNQIEVLQESLSRLERRKKKGEDVGQAISWQKDRLQLLKKRTNS